MPPATDGRPNGVSCAEPIAQRRAAYIDSIHQRFGALEAQMAEADGRRWALNHARLHLGRDLDRANAYLERAALTRDSDIYFIRFLKTLLDFEQSPRLSDGARAHLGSILRGWPRNELSATATWPARHTENHDLMHLTIGLFRGRALGEDLSGQIAEIGKALAWRFERGWVEWNSACYQYHYSNPLIVLADHAPCDDLRRCAASLLNVLLAERAVLGINGFLGGPSFRCRTADANNSPTARKVAYLQDPRYDAFLPTVWLAFGLGEPRFDFATARVEGLEPATTEYATANEPRLKQDEGLFFACSEFQPHPVVTALALEGASRRELVYQGRRYIGWPGPEQGEMMWDTQRWMPASLWYYNTPHVSMGSIHSSGWVCQSRYDKVLFAADPSQGLRVEIILPGVPPHKRRYEARGRVVQHRNWLLAQGTLFEDGGIAARRAGAWNLYRCGKGLCAHYELPGEYHVLQVADLDQYTDDASFVAALAVPEMTGQRVRGTALNGDEVTVNLQDMSICINGARRPHPPAMLHDCDCLRAEYGSGQIMVRAGIGTMTFDAGAFGTG